MSLPRTVLMNVTCLSLIVNNESFTLKSILIDSLNNMFTTSFNLSILKPILYPWLQRSLKPLIREAHCSYAEWVFCFYWASLSAGFSFLFLFFSFPFHNMLPSVSFSLHLCEFNLFLFHHHKEDGEESKRNLSQLNRRWWSSWKIRFCSSSWQMPFSFLHTDPIYMLIFPLNCFLYTEWELMSIKQDPCHINKIVGILIKSLVWTEVCLVCYSLYSQRSVLRFPKMCCLHSLSFLLLIFIDNSIEDRNLINFLKNFL